LVRAHKVWLIEDASYAFLASEAPPPVAALVPERTLYVSSLSKSVGGGLRFGYMVLPANVVARCERTLRAIAWSQPSLMVALGAHWLDSGCVHAQEQDKRAAARAKQRLAHRCLQGLKLQAHPDSFFVWVRLPEAVRASFSPVIPAGCRKVRPSPPARSTYPAAPSLLMSTVPSGVRAVMPSPALVSRWYAKSPRLVAMADAPALACRNPATNRFPASRPAPSAASIACLVARARASGSGGPCSRGRATSARVTPTLSR
jgi:hypothetical protein